MLTSFLLRVESAVLSRDFDSNNRYRSFAMPQIFTSTAIPMQPVSPTAHWFVCAPEGLVVKAESNRLPDGDMVAALGLDAATAHYVGRLGDTDCFAAALPAAAELPPTLVTRSLRKLYGALDED